MTPAAEAVLALRAELWDGDYRPVPIYNPDAPGPSPGKRPWGKNWQHNARQDPPAAAVEAPRPEATNTGILCDQLRAIDIDIEDPSAVAQIRALAFAAFGETIFRHRDNSARCLLLYRAAKGSLPKRVLAGSLGKVEVLGHGQQFVAFGKHPTGADLRWTPEPPNQTPRDSLPAVTEADLTAFLAACAPIVGAETEPEDTSSLKRTPGEPQADPERIAAAMAEIPNKGPADWEAWNRMGMALWAATGGSTAGFDAFDSWSARSKFYDAANTRERWNRYKISPPSKIGAGSIFHEARANKTAGQTELARRGVATSLPAYWPAPTEAREPALRRQAGLIRQAIAEAERLAAARGEVITRRNAEIGERELSPGGRGAVTRRHAKVVAAEQGYGTRLPLPNRLLITGSQGTGKTTQAIAAVAAIRAPLSVWVTEPTLAKAAEIAADYRRIATPDSLPAMVVLGRAQPDPRRPGHKMCDRHQTAEHVAQAGLSVPEHLCAACPLRDECGSRRQARDLKGISGGVFFLAASQLFVNSPAPPPDLMVIDERLTIEAVEVVTIPYAALDPFGIPRVPQVVREKLDLLRTALLLPNALQQLRRAGFDRDGLRMMTEALEGAAGLLEPAIDGSMPDQDIHAALDSATTRTALRSALSVVSGVQREIDQPRNVLNAVHADPQTITLSRLRLPRRIKRATVLALDGTGDPELNRGVFGERMRHERIAVERMGTVVGTIGRGYSRVSITGMNRKGERIKNRTAAAAQARTDIETIRAQCPGSAALFASKDATEAMLSSGAMSPEVPGGTFGALRGLNEWEHTRSAVIVGAMSLGIGDLEDIARAFMASDPAPFFSLDGANPRGWREGQWPYVATRMRRMKDGTRSPVDVDIHPDPRCQRVLEQIREAEVVQAADRTRPVFNLRELLLLNNLAVDAAYDEIRTHHELVAGGNRLELTYKRSGLLPKGGRDLHRLDPARYHTVKAAERAASELPQTLKRVLFYGSGEFTYRVDSQPGLPSKAVIDLTRHPDPLAVLRQHFGNVTEFQGVRITTALPLANPRPTAASIPPATTKISFSSAHVRPWSQAPPET